MAGEVYLGRYKAAQLLGEGGMGRVYLGQQTDTGRQVVIKVMHKHIAANPRFRQAFQREMTVMTRFRHPNAVALYDASIEEDGEPCIIMEYVPGATLAELIEKHGRLNVYRVGVLLGQLCQVLQGAHDNGIIHRDLTPVNVMVMNPGTGKETVKVMDFGLARMGAGPYIPLEKLRGESGNIGGGTPDYVPPEQVRGEEVDHRGDLYSVGVLLFKTITGYLPFEQATTTPEILNSHLELPPPRFSDMGLGGTIPLEIEDVVQCLLAKNPDDRFQSAMELAEEYQRALGRKIIFGDPVPARMLPGPSENRIDPRTVMGHLEAWMPEPIAILKLRGFVQDFGGEIIESEPGLIQFRLLDPTAVPKKQPKNLLSMLGFNNKPSAPPETIKLDLQMEKKTNGNGKGNHILITVMMKPEQQYHRLNDPTWRSCCEQICRDLRGYLISS